MEAPSKRNVINDITNKTIQKLKVNVPPVLNEFIKAADKYQKASQALAQLGIALADSVSKVGAAYQGEYGDGINKLADVIRENESRREEVARLFMLELVEPLKEHVPNDAKDTLVFERNYKKDNDNIRAQIIKLENKTKKAGKKLTPEGLKQQISELNDTIKEAETMRSAKLRDVIMLERRQCNTYLALWTTMLARDVEFHSDAITRIKANEALWKELKESARTLPKDIEDLIAKQERTLVQIQPSADADAEDGGGVRLSYAPNMISSPSTSALSMSYDAYTGYDTTYDQGGADAGYAQGGVLARALYAYDSAEPEDLCLNAGDVVTILQEDDGSGWTKGQDSAGRVGIFPTSYIEYV